MDKVSLVFPAFNRLEFTRQAWAALMANTDWSLVSEFHVYDDGSTDGTRSWLLEAFTPQDGKTPFELSGCEMYFHHTKFRSPMGLTLDWVKRSQAPLLAKLDSDTIYPPNWLNIALDVMDRYPELDMLGLECMRKPTHETELASGQRRGFLPAKYISGLGIYRRSAFAESQPADGGYFGLEEWQQGKRIKAGWILPSLPVFLLDRMPTEPWRSLSEEYVRRGWQRPWSLDLRYKPEQSAMWDWWKPVE